MIFLAGGVVLNKGPINIAIVGDKTPNKNITHSKQLDFLSMRVSAVSTNGNFTISVVLSHTPTFPINPKGSTFRAHPESDPHHLYQPSASHHRPSSTL